MPLLSWTAVPAALSYEVWLNRTGEERSVLHTTVSDTTLQLTTPLPIGRYRLWVRANMPGGDVSDWGTRTFRTAAPPTVLRPAGSPDELRPEFRWSAVEGASGYRVFITNLTTQEGGVIVKDVTDASLIPDADLPFGRYRIWVRALTSDGVVSRWSEHFDTYVGPAPIGPTGALISGSQTFTWTEFPGVTSYQLYVVRNGSVVINETGLTGNSRAASLQPGDYRWWIRGFTDSGDSAWSEPVEFSIGGRTSLSSPRGTSGSIPTLEWPAVPGATSYELYIANDAGVVYRRANITETSFPSPVLPPGVHRIWIRTRLESGENSWGRPVEINVAAAVAEVTSIPLSPIQPTLAVSPAFEFSADEAASGYDIYLHNGSRAILVENLDTPRWAPNAAVEIGPWTWWVRARDAAGRPGPWSEPASTELGGRPQLLTLSGTLITWTPVSQASRYAIQVDDLTRGQTSLIRQDNISTSQLAVELQTGSYRVWVQAISPGGRRSPWSLPKLLTVTAVTQNIPDADSTLLQNLQPDAVLAVQSSVFNFSTPSPATKGIPDGHSVSTKTQPTTSGETTSPVDEVETVDKAILQLMLDGTWLSLNASAGVI
ncbi:MAG: hypothetical protein R3C49_18265 [Planctomycetaceae bacterium]